MSRVRSNSAVDYVNAPPSAFSLVEVLNRRRLHSALRASAEDSVSSRSCIRDLVRPMSVFLIALAAAVALWGFAYKLSLYGPQQNHPSHASVAKMWLGPERQPGLITSHTTKPHSWPKTTSQSDLTIGALSPMGFCQARWTLPETVSLPTGSSLLVGSRSPPSHVPSMQSRVVA
jgi:hypothetical protein